MIRVFKIGGNVIDDPIALDAFLKEFAQVCGRKILVHGGGKEASRLSRQLGIEPRMIDGRRVTDRETLGVVTMVYAGLVNKRIVAGLQALGCDAVGLTGADGNAICATKRPSVPVDFGFVGDISPEGVNEVYINELLEGSRVPIFCAIMHDGQGTLLNCNADSVAAAVAMAMSNLRPTELVYCFEKEGVLRDVDNPASVIELIDSETYEELRGDGSISAGMIPKIDNAFKAISGGVASVTIRKSENILTPGGTCIRK